MRKIIPVIPLLCLFIKHPVYGQENDSLISTIVSHYSADLFLENEAIFYKTLLNSPRHNKAHTGIFFYSHNDQCYISVPIMALAMMNLTDNTTFTSEQRVTMINECFERYIIRKRRGYVVNFHAEVAVRRDSIMSNNMYFLELGFILAGGGVEWAKETKNLNHAERFKLKIEQVFEPYEKFRNGQYGFYWEFYADYFYKLSTSEHLKTASYIIMRPTQEKDILQWIDDHPDEIKNFHEWHDRELKQISFAIKDKQRL